MALLFITTTWKDLYDEIYYPFFEKGIAEAQKNGERIKHPQFIQFLLGNELASTLLGKANKSTLSRVMNADLAARKRFEATMNQLLNMISEAGEPYHYDDHPLLNDMTARWALLLHIDDMDESSKDVLQQSLSRLIDEISDNEPLGLKKRLTPLNNKGDYARLLACFSLIASTLLCWQDDDIIDFANTILPPLPERAKSANLQRARMLIDQNEGTIEELTDLLIDAMDDSIEKGEAHYLLAKRYEQLGNSALASRHLNASLKAHYEPAMRQRNCIEAEMMLNNIRQTLSDTSQVKYNCRRCQDILKMLPAVTPALRGEAAYIIYQFAAASLYPLPSGESPQYYLNISHSCGYQEATEAWLNSQDFKIIPHYESDQTTQGICFINTSYHLARLVTQSLPETWQCRTLDPKSVITAFESDLPLKFLMISDSQDHNLHDTLDLLQLIQEMRTDSPMTIYLRHDDDIHAVIDTALSHMFRRVNVMIINDNLWPAQQLLSQHPLFYPIRHLKLSPTEPKPLLQFIIIGTSKVAMSLVREAFWMLGFRERCIDCRIVVIDELANEMMTHIKNIYPGMAKGAITIDDLDLPELIAFDVPLETASYTQTLTALLNNTPYNYFAIATEDDYVNLDLAKNLRESLIRHAIKTHDETSLLRQTPIAFLCHDHYLAWNTRSLVIETETFGNQWFNTWSLIPFGQYDARYTFDHLDGGTFEELAKGIHLQYSQISPQQRYTSIASTAMDHYCGKQYNRDSSMAIALSMPYRLFQFRDALNQQIVPMTWDILNPSFYGTTKNLSDLASHIKRPERSVNVDEEYLIIAKWEHNRWIRWMLSRGWMPATVEDAVFAYKQNNPHQQLFVARLHPCLCSYEDLKQLSHELLESCGLEKDFYSYDFDNIKATRDLLEFAWTRNHDKDKSI